MKSLCYSLLLVACLKFVNLQGIGSGSNGNLRLCVVEGRGSYKRGSKYCPVLDEQNSGVECVLGTDRLDCLRRISKNTVDFGVFSPEDLIAAQWSQIQVLVTNELRDRDRPFERSVVAVVNRRILPDTTYSLHSVLKNTSLCHPGLGIEDLRPMSDTLSGYLESLVIERSCDPTLSLNENRIKAVAEFFGKACKAGPWVADVTRDAELKRRYGSLCAGCRSRGCARTDRYWGAGGALDCLAEGAGDVLWAAEDDVRAYFGLDGGTAVTPPTSFAYLCRDGSWQPLANNSQPCVWLQRPWPVVIAKTKAATAVSALVSSLSAGEGDSSWRGALAALLELRRAAHALEPPRAPRPHLAVPTGFTEAYSQAGCRPPRHITVCTWDAVARQKCEWLSEAGAVYGVAPPLQCALRPSAAACLRLVRDGGGDVTVARDLLIPAMRDYSLEPILYEATPIVEKMNTVVAYVRKGTVSSISELRGKRASFPRFDSTAWHAVARYLRGKETDSCHLVRYFSEICAPGIEKLNTTQDTIDALTKNCYKVGDTVLEGEVAALRALVEGRSDVAFISMATLNKYKAEQINELWANEPIAIEPVCPEENKEYCFISWTNIAHVFAAQNISDMRRNEITNVFTKLDQLFGKQQPFHSAMFSMYGPFNHQLDVLFHNNTKSLATEEMLKMHPYDKIPFSFERTIVNGTFDSCELADIRAAGQNLAPAFVLLITLVLSLSYSF